MPLNGRNLSRGQNPFREVNPNNATTRQQLLDATRARTEDMQRFLNQRTQRVRRKGDS